MDRSITSVDQYFDNADSWQAELRALRAIMLDTALTEELKWSQPCYTFGSGNVLILHNFKDAATIGFFRGALMKDPEGLLIQPGENSRSGKMMKFASVTDISEKEPIIRSYVAEAIQLVRDGVKVDFSATRADIEYPQELVDRMDGDSTFAEAWEALTPGRKRGYLVHFTGAKQSATRASRIEKFVPKILQGKGWQDR